MLTIKTFPTSQELCQAVRELGTLRLPGLGRLLCSEVLPRALAEATVLPVGAPPPGNLWDPLRGTLVRKSQTPPRCSGHLCLWPSGCWGTGHTGGGRTFGPHRPLLIRPVKDEAYGTALSCPAVLRDSRPGLAQTPGGLLHAKAPSSPAGKAGAKSDLRF